MFSIESELLDQELASTSSSQQDVEQQDEVCTLKYIFNSKRHRENGFKTVSVMKLWITMLFMDMDNSVMEKKVANICQYTCQGPHGVCNALCIRCCTFNLATDRFVDTPSVAVSEFQYSNITCKHI